MSRNLACETKMQLFECGFCRQPLYFENDHCESCGHRLGYVPETMELATRIARMPVTSLVETKRLVLAGRIDAIRAARAREDQAFARMVGAPANL